MQVCNHHYNPALEYFHHSSNLSPGWVLAKLLLPHTGRNGFNTGFRLLTPASCPCNPRMMQVKVQGTGCLPPMCELARWTFQLPALALL